jgi:PKD repeat protein
LLRHLLRCLLFVLVLPTAAQATHIVGGEMNYTCLGNNQYEITLTIFRDCFYGNPLAWFDDPASVGIFDVDNNLLQEVQMSLMNNDTLAPVLSSICFVAPPDVCVHTTTYRDTIELEPRIGGYQLAYQRCCRNQTILNIVDPLASGATYGVTISERALLECNSNPKFQEWPPIYICVDEPILFDQSALDIDGDSIVYRLCTPLLGANQAIPMPQPPNNPPYAPINWVDPPYNVDNMLNGFAGGEPLAIDSQTGLLTGLPNTVGQFVVGICVEEYRDGELISTTRRDFQYNVGVCGRAVSAFFAPEIQCESLTVEFNNESQNADDFLWIFNDPNNPDATSTAVSPTFTFQDTGLYTVMLIAEPGTICQDTAFQEVYLQDDSLFPDFSVDYVACTDSLTIQVNDLSFDTISTPVEWLWEVSPLGLTSNEQNPTFAITANGGVSLSLTLTAANGCEKMLEEFIPVELIEEELLTDTITICFGDNVALNPTIDTSYTYEWMPSPWIGDLSNPNPIVSPDDTTTFTVFVTDAEGFCMVERSITVAVPEPLSVELPPDLTTCDPEILLTATTNRPGEYFWDTTVNFTTVFSEEDSVLVTPFGETDYYLLFRDTIGCTKVDSVTIVGNGVNGQIIGNPVQCKGDTFGLFFFVEDPLDTITYNWFPTDGIIIGANSRSPILSFDEAGNYTLFLDMENQFGCPLSDSVDVTILDTEFQEDFVTQTQCSGFTVDFALGLQSMRPSSIGILAIRTILMPVGQGRRYSILILALAAMTSWLR